MATKILSTLAFLSILFINPVTAQNALHFDGTNDQVNCGTDTAFDIGGTTITMEAWIYATGWSSDVFGNSILLKEDNNNDNGYLLRAGDGGRLGMSIGVDGKGGTWNDFNTKGSVLSLNTWHHVAGTYDGSYMRLYVDGVCVDSVSRKIAIGVTSSQALTIGYNISNGRYWKGRIDEVRLWNVVRTEKELYDNKDAEFSAYQSGLKAYYKFDHGVAYGNNSTVTSVLDYSGRHNDGTLSNFALSGSTSNWVGGANLSQDISYNYDTIEACNIYIDPVTYTVYNSSGTYTDTVNNYIGCDSVLIKDITINKNKNAELNVAVCDEFQSPTSSKIYKSSGTYYETISASTGCDSIIKINLTVGVQGDTIDEAVCYAYTSPSGKYTWSTSGTYADTLPSAIGCDSVLTINLDVIGASASAVNLSFCDSVQSPSGKYWYKESGMVYDTLANYFGCDSILSITVKSNVSYDTLYPNECSAYTLPSGKIAETTGVYRDTIKNKTCYSAFTVYATINAPSSEAFDLVGCRNVPSVTGTQVYTETGTYFDTIPNATGCDSFITMNVTVHDVNIEVVAYEQELIAQAPVGNVQWLDCKNGYAEVASATNKSFTYPNRGEFAVEVTNLTCTDTSECYSIIGLGIKETSFDYGLKLYPNPSDGSFTITSEEAIGHVEYSLVDVYGRIIDQKSIKGFTELKSNMDIISGNYFVYIKWEGGVKVIPLSIN